MELQHLILHVIKIFVNIIPLTVESIYSLNSAYKFLDNLHKLHFRQ